MLNDEILDLAVRENDDKDRIYLAPKDCKALQSFSGTLFVVDHVTAGVSCGMSSTSGLVARKIAVGTGFILDCIWSSEPGVGSWSYGLRSLG